MLKSHSTALTSRKLEGEVFIKNNSARDFSGGPAAKTPNAGGPGLIPGWVTRSHKLQLRVLLQQLKDSTCHTERSHMPR